MKAITDFLATHPLIPIRSLERAAGCPNLTIQQAITGEKPAIPDKWIWNIIRVLCPYGFEVRRWNLDNALSAKVIAADGLLPVEEESWKFTYDAEIDAFFVEKRIDREPVVHEVYNEQKSSSHFEYQIWCYRSIISDEIELFDFLKSFKDE